MKSLYTRIVLIFVSIVMFSLFAAFILSSWLFDSRAQILIEDILATNGNQMIHTYQSTPSAQLVPFMQNLSGLSFTHLQLYDQTGKPLLDQSVWTVQVQPDDIKRVIAGEKVSDTHRAGHMATLPVIGLPFQADGQPYALFVTMKRNSVDEELMNSVHLMYVLILFLGSFLILVAARYLVTPILRLTEATKRMARGNFDVVLPTNRKDEIGILSVSFNQMANELAKLDQMRRDFVSNVSHEIQSPLTSISGFSKALKQKKMSEESRLHYLTIIEKESERLSRLGQNLLRLSFLQQENEHR